MPTIVIRNLDPVVKRRLQLRAARNGRSMEAEARAFLTEGLAETPKTVLPADAEPRQGLGTRIHNLFAPLGGVELRIPPRHMSHRPIPTFDE
jgi:antitoxin FitA